MISCRNSSSTSQTLAVSHGASRQARQRPGTFLKLVGCRRQGTPSLRELKLQYYQLLIRYHAHSDAYLEVCRCYRALFEDAEISADPDQWQPILKKICW